MSKGVIVVSDDGISVCQTEERGWSQTSLPRTVEGLHEAARILASLMELPCEDIEEECRRIHAREQRDAFLRDAMESFLKGYDSNG